MTYEWTAPNGVRVESSVPRRESRTRVHALFAAWRYALKKYGLGVYMG